MRSLQITAGIFTRILLNSVQSQSGLLFVLMSSQSTPCSLVPGTHGLHTSEHLELRLCGVHRVPRLRRSTRKLSCQWCVAGQSDERRTIQRGTVALRCQVGDHPIITSGPGEATSGRAWELFLSNLKADVSINQNISSRKFSFEHFRVTYECPGAVFS